MAGPGLAVPPVRYDVETTIATLQKSGREPFGSKFFFASGNKVIYRVLPADRSDTDPATRWEFWSPEGIGELLPVAGYESLEVVGLNAEGEAVGRSVTEIFPGPQPHQEAALYWTVAGGSVIPPGFDAGYSGLKTLNGVGQAAGFTDSGTFRFVRWTADDPATLDDITLPIGYTYGEIHGSSDGGKVLLYTTMDGGANPRLAVWDGETSAIVGPAPNVGETFSPANCAMNGNGDVAVIFYTDGGGYRIVYIPASAPESYQIFSFPGPVTSVYNLHISNAGLACAQTSANQVSIVSSTRAEQRTYAGYSPFLNADGAFVFGNQSKFSYWDAAAWTGAPVLVPLSLPASPAAPTLVGFNDDGRLLTLSDNAAQTTRTLSILKPVPPLPTVKITVTPIRKTVALRVGATLRKRKLVRTHVVGKTQGAVRFVLRGKPPRGLRFGTVDGSLTGRAKQKQTVALRIAAVYSSAGVQKRSPFTVVRVAVSAPASLRKQ